MSELILSKTGVPLKSLAGPVLLTYWIANEHPSCYRKPLLKIVDHPGTESAFWAGYWDELFAVRLTKADMLARAGPDCPIRYRRDQTRPPQSTS